MDTNLVGDWCEHEQVSEILEIPEIQTWSSRVAEDGFAEQYIYRMELLEQFAVAITSYFKRRRLPAGAAMKIYALHFLHGYTAKEIATKLEWEVFHVKYYLTKITNVLKTAFANYTLRM